MAYNKDKLFISAYNTAKNYIIPHIEKVKPIKRGTKVLEIGAGEGGLLKAFNEKGCYTVGVELSEGRLQIAREKLSNLQNCELLALDIHRYDTDKKFDIILLKDSIEHIPEKEKLLRKLKQFLAPEGIIWLGFPPFQMPFGGHQQIISTSKILRFLPYMHLLPMKLYVKLLKIGKTPEQTIEELKEIKELGLSIEDFEKLVRKTDFRILHKQFFFLNPSYKYRFGLPVFKASFPFTALYVLRNFYIMGVYYIIASE